MPLSRPEDSPGYQPDVMEGMEIKEDVWQDQYRENSSDNAENWDFNLHDIILYPVYDGFVDSFFIRIAGQSQLFFMDVNN